MNEQAMRIGKKTFVTSVMILLFLMMFAGVLTKIVPSGTYERTLQDDREMIVVGSYTEVTKPDYPIWRWFAAPVEVLGSGDSTIVIVIIVFLVIVGGAINLLNHSGVISTMIEGAIRRFEDKKILLVFIITFIFMAFGAFVGIFEEVVPLVPIVVVLAYRLKLDTLTGLGMSLLAAGYGFAAAVSNPFTIGVAQGLAELPVFSGAFYRLIIFCIYYFLLCCFLYLHIRRLPKSAVLEQKIITEHQEDFTKNCTKASFFAFVIAMIALLSLLVSTLFSDAVSAVSMPLVGVIFLIGGLSAGLLSKLDKESVIKTFIDGLLGVAPAIILILMAASIKQIILSGQIMDTILYYAADFIQESNILIAVVFFFLLVMILEFMIGSGSAKAFLVMPIVVPLADLLSVNRQIMVLAFQFGDGFSNCIYPTNPIILIALGLCSVSYVKWFKFTYKFQLLTLLLNIGFLGIALLIDYGPF